MIEDMGGSPELWIQAGNWAEWVGSILAGGSLIGLVVGLRRERDARRRDERDRADAKLQHQASQVGAWIEPVLDLVTGTLGGDTWRLRVANSSDLPIRSVIGFLFRAIEPYRLVVPSRQYR